MVRKTNPLISRKDYDNLYKGWKLITNESPPRQVGTVVKLYEDPFEFTPGTKSEEDYMLTHEGKTCVAFTDRSAKGNEAGWGVLFKRTGSANVWHRLCRIRCARCRYCCRS